MPLIAVNPESLPPPRGYNHGMKGAGEILFVAGQVGWTREGQVVSGDFVSQFPRAFALQNRYAALRIHDVARDLAHQAFERVRSTREQESATVGVRVDVNGAVVAQLRFVRFRPLGGS